MPSEMRQRIYTIGHSNHEESTFLDLLRSHRIDVVADVRTQPYSKYSSQYNSEAVKVMLSARGIQYVFLGRELGGRPGSEEFYDDQGHVLYDRLAVSPRFLEGIVRLENGGRDHRVAMMCSEEDPAGCHRYLLVARVLESRGVDVRHIRGDGRLQSRDDLKLERTGGQLMLFEELEEPPWKSIRSVLPNPRPTTSSSD